MLCCGGILDYSFNGMLCCGGILHCSLIKPEAVKCTVFARGLLLKAEYCTAAATYASIPSDALRIYVDANSA
jgi:hypothetical protein